MLWHKILETARYTPSPHNVQPWKIRIIDESKAELFIDQSRTLPEEDVTGCFILCAMGMFLEALRTVTLNEGKGFYYTLIDSPNVSLKPFAHLFLKSEHPLVTSYSNELFLKRQTSRLASRPQIIPVDVRHRLSSFAQEGGQCLSFVDVRGDIEEFMDKNTTAVFDDLNDRPYHHEIVSWFRYSTQQGAENKDGLEARCMMIPPLEFYFFAKAPWAFKIPGLSWMIRRHYRGRIGHVQTLGIISGPFWQKDETLGAGAFLMKLWLELTRYDLYIHPFGNLVTNGTANRWMHDKTKLKDIWLVFRVGYSEPAPRSHRLNLEDILID